MSEEVPMVTDGESNEGLAEELPVSRCSKASTSTENNGVVVEENYASDEDCIATDMPYDPALVPDQNDLLQIFREMWMSIWGTNVKNGKNLFKKHIDERNYDPLRAKAIGKDIINSYRLVVMQDGKTAQIPGRFIEEQGLCVEKSKGENKQSRKWHNFMEFAYERLVTVRKQVGNPEQIETPHGPLFQSSFSKPSLVAQFRQMTVDGVKKLNEMDSDAIAGLNIEKGKKMLKELDELLEWMDEEIIPTTTKNMTEAVHNMALLKVRFSDDNQNELEYFNEEGNFVVVKCPSLKNKSPKDMKRCVERWLAKNLLPLLGKWTDRLVEKLPEGMAALAAFTGVDLENYAVQECRRGNCILCELPGKTHNNLHLSVMQKVHLIHIRFGLGTLFISLEGLGAEGMTGVSPGQAIIPRGSTCVPPTECELEGAGGYRCTLDVVFNVFFNEKTTATVPIAYNAKGSERKSVKEIQETVFKGREVKGFRIGESSMMTNGSLPNLALQDALYEDADGAQEVRSASGIQCSRIHGRRMTSGLYKNAQIQGTLTLRNVGNNPEDERCKNTLLYLLYNKEDSTLCQNAMILAVVSIILQSPLLIATGSTKFLRELCEMLPELVARSAVTEKNPWMVDVKMPPLNRAVIEVLNIANEPGLVQIHKYSSGCFSEFGIPPGTEFRNAPKINIRKAKASKPDIFEKKDKSNTGLIIQDNQVAWGEPGLVRQIGEVNMMQSLPNFEMSENSSTGDNETQKRGSEVPEIGEDISRRAEEPRLKRRVVYRDDEGVLVENKNEDLDKAVQLLPTADDIVKELKRKDFLTSSEVSDLSRKLQEKVDAATEEKMIIADRKNEAAVDNQKEIQEKTQNVERLKKSAFENNENIQKLLAEQNKLTLSIKAANVELMTLKKREADRKVKEVKDMAAERKRVGEKAIAGGSMIMAEIRSKDLEKFGTANLQPVASDPVAMEQVPEHLTPLCERAVTNHIPNVAPPGMDRWEERFVTYAHWRWSYIELVKVILAILEKMRNKLDEFEGTPPQEATGDTPAVEGTGKHSKKFHQGSFRGIAQLGKQRGKVSVEGRIHYHAARKLIAMIKTLAEIHADNTEVPNNVVIDATETPAEQSKKRKTNANQECNRYLKGFAAEMDDACREVTGQGLVMPWACQGDIESASEQIFTDIAREFAIQKTREGKDVWREAQGKRYLEVKITAVVCPLKPFLRPNTTENQDENMESADRRVDESQSSSAGSGEWVEKEASERIMRRIT